MRAVQERRARAPVSKRERANHGNRHTRLQRGHAVSHLGAHGACGRFPRGAGRSHSAAPGPVNLMMNSIETMKAVHGRRELTLESTRDGREHVRVAVIDTSACVEVIKPTPLTRDPLKEDK